MSDRKRPHRQQYERHDSSKRERDPLQHGHAGAGDHISTRTIPSNAARLSGPAEPHVARPMGKHHHTSTPDTSSPSTTKAGRDTTRAVGNDGGLEQYLGEVQ